jgi:hypothetical protein
MLIHPINVRQSAATGAGAIVWGLYNPNATKIIVARLAMLQMFFDGTAAATLMKYELVKYTGVTAFSGASPTVPMIKRTGLASSVVGVARTLDTGLTATNGAAQTPIPLGAMGRVTQTTTNFQSLWSTLGFQTPELNNAVAIELATNELLAIRQSVVSVIGDNIVGYVEATEV